MSLSAIRRRVRLSYISSFAVLLTLCIMLLAPLGAAAQDSAGIMTGDKSNVVDAGGNAFAVAEPTDKSAPDYADKKKAFDKYKAQTEKEPLAVKLADSVGHVRVATNFAWTLNTGYLVLFMQAGFALLTCGLVRKKNAGHLLFEVVFMETAGYIIVGAICERITFGAFLMAEMFMGAILYPIFGNWVWGGGWMSQLGSSMGLGMVMWIFAGSTVVHAVGGFAAMALAMILGPRLGKDGPDGKPRAFPAHNLVFVVIGTFIVLFGWMGFNPGSNCSGSLPRWLHLDRVSSNYCR